MQTNTSKTVFVVVFLIVIAALSRLLPHIPNFTPIAAIGLFSASYFHKKYLAFAVPILAMLLSDFFIGFHTTMLWVYGSMVAIVVLGQYLLQKISVVRVLGSAMVSSIVFFVVTNLGVWISWDFYAKTWAGLVQCYTLAIPFFGNTLMGDVFYCTVLFGSFALAKRYILKLAIA